MCSCDEDDEPAEITAKVLAAQPLIAKVYKFHSGGGGLHCLLDDGNIECPGCERSHANFVKGLPWKTSKAALRAEIACIKAFNDMEYDERYAAINLYHGHIDANGWSKSA